MLRTFSAFILLTFLSNSALLCQHILSAISDPYVISDFILDKEVYYKLDIISPCKYGTLSVLENGQSETYEIGGYVVQSKFDVLLVDHGIKVPSIVFKKIAEKIEVKINFVYKLREKK